MSSKWVVEAKVASSTLASAGVGAVVAVLNDIENDHSLLGSTPAPIQALILIAIPAVASFVAGWSTKHTPRTDTASPNPPANGPVTGV